MKNKFLICGALTLGALIATPAFATTANTLSDFGGIEEPEVIYHPSSNTFTTGDTFVNITDEGGGVFKMYLRFSTSSWDGDRTTTSTDRQRAEVKVLGNRQAPGETYEYASTWRTDPAMTVGDRFCHITQVKAYDGNDTSDPLVATTLYSGGVVKVEKDSHDDSGLIGVRTFSWTPNTWTRVVNRLTTSSSDGASDGALSASVNGDSFTGVSGTKMYRATATQYQPKWGLYRGVDVNQTFGNDYMEHSAVSAIKGTSSPTVSAPTFSPGGGSYTSTQNVTITSSTSGASIRYTLDGSTPSETAGTVYSSPVNITSTKTLKAIAYQSGSTDSSVTSATYTITIAPPPTVNFEAESLTYTASGATASVQTDTNSSGGKWIELAGNSTGDNISFAIPSVVAGTYQVKMEWKGNTSRGILQLSVDGKNVGGTLDQYSTAQSYPTTTFGTVTFASAGTHTIKLTVTGKNSSSSAYQLSADKFTLVGQ